MKTFILVTSLLLASLLSFAQLKGSGKTISKNYSFENFDKIYFDDLDGKIEIEVGKPFGISVVIDDNLENILSIEENTPDKVLQVKFLNNKNNWRYIENTNIKIKITLPKIIEIKNNGNSKVSINNIIGKFLKIENSSNGDLDINGEIESLAIKNQSNGTLNAKKLIAKNAEIKCKGNGSITVNVSENITAKVSGNGSVKNIGKAKFDCNSTKTGNGSLINNNN
jgi:hypothetical protein